MAKTRRSGKTQAAKKSGKKTAARKPAAKKAAKKTAAKRSAPKKAAPKKKVAKKAAPKKKVAKKAAPKRAKPQAKKAAAKPKPAAKKAAKSSEAKKAGAKKPGKRRSIKGVPDGYGAHPDAGLTARQLSFLYNRLVEERARKKSELERHMQEALGEAGVMPDETDMAQRHTEQAYLIRFADKERKLLNEIERALEKLRLADYGVCEGTEEPIGFKRLELRPWTRYSVAYKEQIERERSQHRR